MADIPSWLLTSQMIERIENEKPNKEIQKYITKAYRDAIYDFYKHLFKHQFVADFMSEGNVPVEPTSEIYKEVVEKAKDRVTTKPVYVLLTINPKPGVSLKELAVKVEKFVQRCFIKSYMYVYEIREEGGGGLHCHMLLHYTCKPYDLKRASRSTFKELCDVNNPAILNQRFVEPEILQQKINYLKGDKQDKKKKAVEFTKAWRLQQNIKDVYESEHPLGTDVPLLGCDTSGPKVI